MTFQKNKDVIEWKIHFASPVEKVYYFLTTDEGRQQYWAEKTKEKNGIVEFHFLNYPVYFSRILAQKAPVLFTIEYFGTEVTFHLHSTEDKGTILHLQAMINKEPLRYEMTAGWVSVLLAMKAAVDFGVDLRNHHPEHTWDLGFADN